MTLIRRSAVQTHAWMSEEEFNRSWALCQMTPGINLIALTILVGKKVAGFRGAVICLLGLLFPSALITILITAGFLLIRDLPTVKGALKGILPATVGLGLVTACQMAQQPILASWKRGAWQTLFGAFLLVGSALLLWSGKASVIVVLLVAGAIAALENWVVDRFWPSQESEVPQ